MRTVERRERGSCDAGVRINLVRAASIGARRRDDMAVAAVAMRTVAVGEIDARIEVSEKEAGDVRAISVSGIPNVAAKKDRKNVSKVRNSIE